MAQRDFFRVGDPVIVHGYQAANIRKKFPGRVICTNRKTRTDLCVVVLVDIGVSESLQTFHTNGKRALARDPCYIELGVLKDEEGD